MFGKTTIVSMEHPNLKCQLEQAEFLASCDPSTKDHHSALLRISNAIFIYHQKAKEYSPTIRDWNEWLDNTKEPLKTAMQAIGFSGGRTTVPFRRFVLEKNDVGLDSFLKANLTSDDYQVYIERNTGAEPAKRGVTEKPMSRTTN